MPDKARTQRWYHRKASINTTWVSLLLFLALTLVLVACSSVGTTPSPSQGTAVPTSPPQSSPTTPSATASVTAISSKPIVPLKSIRMIDTNDGWALTASSILKTADGGLHWNDVTPANAGINQDARGQFMNMQDAWIAIGPANQQEGPGVALLRTTDGGLGWQRITIPDSAVSRVDFPHFITPQEGWLEISSTPGAGGAGSDIWHSIDGGQTWTRLASNKSSHGLSLGFVTGISFRDAQFGIATGNLGGGGDNTVPSVALSRDGGQTWQTIALPHLLGGYVNPQNTSQPPVFFGNVVILPVIVGVQNDNLLVLYRSNDGGRNWFQTSVAHIQSDNTYVLNPSYAWATDTQSGKLYSTGDGGSHWFPTSTNSYQLKMLSFTDSQNGWSLTSDQLLQTMDGGRTWRQIRYTIQ